jgi:carboxylate-amine ligase
VRPKPEFGTIEVRVCDTPLSVDKAVDIAAFVRGLAALALRGTLHLPQPRRHVTEGKVSRFLACRDGLQARLFDPARGQWVTARDWALALFAQLDTERPTPDDEAALQALARACEAGEEDHARMRAIWRRLSPTGELPSGAAPGQAMLVAYAAELGKLLLDD